MRMRKREGNSRGRGEEEGKEGNVGEGIEKRVRGERKWGGDILKVHGEGKV